ncbi:MAG: cytochrome c maturation protein CcmE [Myxococcota bacterium]|nr:cytochrome c maturation protein CcmE [Myxococcota bacterium]
MSTENEQQETPADSPTPAASGPAPRRKGGYPLIIAAMIAIGLVLVVSSSFSSGTYSLTIGDLAKDSDLYIDRDVKVVGNVKAGSVDIRTQARSISVHFVIEDGLGGEVPVVYPHNPPDPFKEGREVIVEGTVQPPTSEGESPAVLCHILTVKCPSKYQEEGLDGGDESYYKEKYGKPFPADAPEAAQ